MSGSIHQFHHWTSPGDAITNQMRFLREALREAGISSEIFSKRDKCGKEIGIQRWDASKLSASDLLLIHHSQGTPDLEGVLKSTPTKALVYHNITPGKYFRHDPKVMELCVLGRQQLEAITQACRFFFADSRYNAQELEAEEITDVELLPLFAAAPIVDRPKRDRGRHLVFVGRLCPHKDQALLIETMGELARISPKARLTLVGRGDPLYAIYLRKLVRAARAEKIVDLRGAVTDAELGKIYQSADAFVCVSQHEGYCIPLVEAMRHGLPVISTMGTAITETLENAGVQAHTRDPRELAALIEAALSDDLAHQAILESQRLRYEKIRAFQREEVAVEKLRRTLQKMGVP